MLALSVREAMEQAVVCLQSGHVTAGMDIGMHGGHSTDGMSRLLIHTLHSESNLQLY